MKAFRGEVSKPLNEARWTLSLAKNKLGQRLRRARRTQGLPQSGREPLTIKRMPPKNTYPTSRRRGRGLGLDVAR